MQKQHFEGLDVNIVVLSLTQLTLEAVLPQTNGISGRLRLHGLLEMSLMV